MVTSTETPSTTNINTKYVDGSRNNCKTIYNCLSNEHKNILQLRGISEDFALLNGLRTVTSQEAFDCIGQHQSGLLIPYFSLDGNSKEDAKGRQYFRLRCDSASDRRYTSAKESGVSLYFPRLNNGLSWEKVALDNTKTIYIIEGELKALALAELGLTVIGIAGCWSWIDKGCLHGDFFRFKLEGRKIVLLPDSDINNSGLASSYSHIRNGWSNLARLLHTEGVNVRQVVTPLHPYEGKLALDDFLGRGVSKDFILSYLKVCEYSCLLIPKASKKNPNPKPEYLSQPVEDAAIHQSYQVSLLAWGMFVYRLKLGWYRYIGTHWISVDQPLDKNLLCTTSVDSDANLSFARFLQLYRAVNNITDIGKTLTSIIVDECSTRLTVPEHLWLKTDAMNFLNGRLVFINKDSDETVFLPGHDYREYLTQCYPYNWKPTTDIPNAFGKFLKLFTLKDAVKEQIILAYMRLILEPRGRDDVFNGSDFVLWIKGAPGNGKSTLGEICWSLVGAGNSIAFEDSTLERQENVYSLVGKRFGLYADAKSFVPNATLLQKVVSNEHISVRKFTQHSLSTRLGIRLLFSSNELPLFSQDNSSGMDRRLIVLEFPCVPDVVCDDILELCQRELVDIFNYVLSMPLNKAKQILKNAHTQSALQSVNVERKLDQDIYLQFLDDKFNQLGSQWLPANDIYQLFIDWCRLANKKSSVTQRKFSQKITEFVNKRRTNKAIQYQLIDVAALLSKPQKARESKSLLELDIDAEVDNTLNKNLLNKTHETPAEEPPQPQTEKEYWLTKIHDDLEAIAEDNPLDKSELARNLLTGAIEHNQVAALVTDCLIVTNGQTVDISYSNPKPILDALTNISTINRQHLKNQGFTKIIVRDADNELQLGTIEL